LALTSSYEAMCGMVGFRRQMSDGEYFTPIRARLR
jgi:hypothetical protein